MNAARHYENKLAYPAEGSRLEFFLRAHQILAQYGPPPIWLSLDAPSPDLPRWERRFLTAWKRHTDSTDGLFRQSAIDMLLRAGIEPDRLATPEVKALQKALEDGARAQAVVWEQHRPKEPVHDGQGAPYPKAICQEVIIGATMAQRPSSLPELADYLNFGLRRGPGITTDHIRRARSAFDRRLATTPAVRRGGLAIFSLTLTSILQRFQLMRDVLDAASRHPDYRRFKGAALADRIEDLDGLYSCVEYVGAMPLNTARSAVYMEAWLEDLARNAPSSPTGRAECGEYTRP